VSGIYGPIRAMLITKDKTQQITTPVVKKLAKYTVGAGDSMVAGIVLSLSKRQGYFPGGAVWIVACGAFCGNIIITVQNCVKDFNFIQL